MTSRVRSRIRVPLRHVDRQVPVDPVGADRRTQRDGEEIWGHIGDIVGCHADLWHAPESGVTVAALINYQAGPQTRTSTGWPKS